ncbi:MAG: hypothetical protein IPI82_03685 [Candidatus Microthrix sp.]|nr:hypothetical protein [Candidatus Microthrix sp.]MBK7321570.1 hypothetical protein [Candidatus Microthrix sp.]
MATAQDRAIHHLEPIALLGIMKGPDGRALLFAHLVNDTAARVTFGAAVVGAGAGVLGVLTATSWLVRGRVFHWVWQAFLPWRTWCRARC